MATIAKDAVPAPTVKRARRQPGKLHYSVEKGSARDRQEFLNGLIDVKVEQAIRLLKQHSMATPGR